jgi:AcrR family transcriptional regulator
MSEHSKQEKGQKTRQEILAAAASVFIAKGYEGASISDIAAQKSMNQSLIYHYFKDKKALWQEVKKWVLADFLGLCQTTADSPLNRKEFFTHLAQQVRYLDQHPDVLRLLLWQQLEEKTEANSMLQIETIAKAVATLRKQGEVDPSLVPNLFALFVISLLQGPLQPECVAYPVDIQTYIATLTTKLEGALNLSK